MNASAAHPPPFDSSMQCEPQHVWPMMLFLVAVHVAGFTRSNVAATAACGGIAVALGLYALNYLGTKTLTIAHLFVGSLAFEGAVRIAQRPLFTVSSWPELIFILLCIYPNMLVTLSKTCCPNSGGNSLDFGLRDFEAYTHIPFFERQHAFLHAAITVLLVSTATSFFPRLRRSPRAQQARIFIEPSMLVTVAMILSTHDHGASTSKGHELESHPVIGSLMCLAAFFHTFTAAASFAYPTASGAPADLTEVSPGGGPAPLRMLRLATAFAYLLVADFLFIDTFMEYLGCRQVLVKTGDSHDPGRAGWSPMTELSTYKATTIILAVLTLAFVIVPLVGDGSATTTPTDGEHEERVSLLALADVQRHRDVHPKDHAEVTQPLSVVLIEKTPLADGSEGSAEGSA